MLGRQNHHRHTREATDGITAIEKIAEKFQAMHRTFMEHESIAFMSRAGC